MNPYRNLEKRAFWAPSVGRRDVLEIADLWVPKWRIGPKQKIVTFGSCFAQHFGRALLARGYNWYLTEVAPEGLVDEQAKRFNYGVFSCRTGNIYTVTLLKQWMEWATGAAEVPDEVWEKNGRVYDPFRPAIEPDGFASAEEMKASRSMAIEAFGAAMRESQVFVFTLGLTESWVNKQHGYEYPMCPGTVAGTFDADQHVFANQSFLTIKKTLKACIRLLHSVNPKIRVLLTVSPVPLTATMSGDHVLVATMRSKSVLRGVAAEVVEEMKLADYFPSYEIIAAPPFEGVFYEDNKRSVTSDGVAHVMDNFFDCLHARFPESSDEAKRAKGGKVARQRLAIFTKKRKQAAAAAPVETESVQDEDDLVCEEQLLAAFEDKSGRR